MTDQTNASPMEVTPAVVDAYVTWLATAPLAPSLKCVDAAETWLRFLGARSGLPLNATERELQGAVFVRLLPFIDPRRVVDFAESAWGAIEFTAHTDDGESAISWVPDDGLVIATVPSRVGASILHITRNHVAGVAVR